MFVEPLFLLLSGFATVAFASAAFLAFIRNHESATFFTLAAGATAFLLFFRLPETPIQLVLICLITGIADIACSAPKTRG
jgi:hypothetical protein